MGEIGASSRVIDERRGDFGGKIEEQPPHPGKRDGISPEQRGKPARRVHRRGRHVSRTNNSPLANRASWLPPSQSASTASADLHARKCVRSFVLRNCMQETCEGGAVLGFSRSPSQWPGRNFPPGVRKLLPGSPVCPRALAFVRELLLISLP